MDSKEILKFCLKEGILLDEETLKLFTEADDFEIVKSILENIKRSTNQRIITKQIFINNQEEFKKIFSIVSGNTHKSLEKLKINFGLSLEISKEISLERVPEEKEAILETQNNVSVFPTSFQKFKKIEVEDFVKYFKGRFSDLKNILQERAELTNLVSIGKISGERQNFSVIGIIYDKRITKNKNLILSVEDLTGRMKVLINQNKEELYKQAEEIPLDSVIGFTGSGSKEILFVNNLFFPDLILQSRKKSNLDESVVFLGDLHFGSKRFLFESFNRFIDYLNGKTGNISESKKIKYLLIVGDLVTGIGNYPNQEKDLEFLDLEEQFQGIADLLSKIRKDIKIIISPGNHDGVRLMEPQQAFDEKYAWPLRELSNVILTENPSNINIGLNKNFSGFSVLMYHGFSFPYYANSVPRLMLEKAMNSPEKIIKYLLKTRHLAPTHSSVQYFPSEKDTHLIRDVPDIFFSGHIHKSAVAYYNNILLVSGSSWESKTSYQEKFGNEPDHCKVPMFNLKTREVKILDFE